MRRPSMPLFRCFFWTLLIAVPRPCVAQPSIPVEDRNQDILETKELAKARFETEQATLHDLAQARRDALNVCFQIRKELYAAAANEPGTGPVTLDLLLETWAELVEAEPTLSDKRTDRLTVRASHWLYTWETERITEAQFRVERVSLTTLMQARSARLADEMKLLQVLGEEKRPDPFVTYPAFLDGSVSNKDAKKLSKAQFEASHATLHDLAHARRDAVETCFRIRQELYAAGANEPGTGMPVGMPVCLYHVLETRSERVEAELAWSDKPADRLAIGASHWLYTWETERITAARFREGRISRSSLMQARSDRLAEEIKLLPIFGDNKRSGPFVILPVFPDGKENDDKEGAKELAKAQFDASQAKPRDLALARRDAIKFCLADRWGLFLAGANELGSNTPITPNLLLKTQAQLLEAEHALSDKPADQLAAYETLWQASLIAEEITRRQYAAGRVSASDYARSRVYRLDAEIRLREFQTKRNEK